MKALVFDKKVVQLESNIFEVAPELIWMDAPTGCKVGWILEDGILKEDPTVFKKS